MLPFVMKACCLINIQLCLFVPFKWYIYITVWAWLVDKHQPGYNRSLPTTYFFTFLLVRFRKMPPSITSVGFLFVKSSLITVTNIANTEWLLRFKLYQRFKTIYHQLDCQLLTPNLNVLELRNKTSVPVFYCRINYGYKFGCVWIKSRLCKY